MKKAKRVLVLSSSEYRQMLHGLIHFRNKLIEQGRYSDAIDELILRLQHAKTQKEVISHRNISTKIKYNTKYNSQIAKKHVDIRI